VLDDALAGAPRSSICCNLVPAHQVLATPQSHFAGLPFMHFIAAKNGSAVIDVEARMKLAMNKNPVTRGMINFFFHNPEVPTPASHIAGESKARSGRPQR
jgi:hypothetical protein